MDRWLSYCGRPQLESRIDAEAALDRLALVSLDFSQSFRRPQGGQP